ncbi:MAG TPA: transcription elongation factor GreA [Chloroflexota bacterium]|jgi:transcription elongation factor GreA|nr:transcription elongation factor GreA [Chloroflexota bacterium]
MANSATSGTTSMLRLGEAVSTYLSGLAPRERETQAPALMRFVRWLGADREVGSIRPVDLELYQEQLGDGGFDPTKSLESVRAFLAEARKRGWTATNLAVHIKVRRRPTARGARQQASEAPPRIEMTAAGREALQRELERLENEVRPELTAALQRAAADKDFRENAPYHAAKQQLAEVQSRINALRAQLMAATVVDTVQTERAALGTRVVLRDLDADEELSYTLVGPGEIDARRGRISIQSPVGRALADHVVGDTVEVQTPAGTYRYRIERIEVAE